jgi:predicted ferric reductase
MSDDKAARLAAIRAAKSTSVASAGVALPLPAQETPDFNEIVPALALHTLLLILFAAILGAFAAVVVLPAWLPNLSASLLGPEPKAYWYLARSSAFVAFGLLWLSMVFGLLMTNKLARTWPGGPTAFELHQHTSLLGLAFALFHGLILLGDSYIHASLAQVLIPFAYSGFAPFWVGLGQLSLYLLAIVGLSFYARAWLGRRAWRLIHFLSFVLFVLALLHGLLSGTNSTQLWAQALYWATGGSTLFLLCYRVLVSRLRRPAQSQSGASRT